MKCKISNKQLAYRSEQTIQLRWQNQEYERCTGCKVLKSRCTIGYYTRGGKQEYETLIFES